MDFNRLHGNPVGDTGIKYISESLKDIHSAYLSHKDEENPPKYCQLLELDLGDTAIGDEGVEHVSTLLESNTSLKTLNLNGNTKITVAGWKRLGKALKKNTTLHTLTLDFNKIGDDGMAGLVSGLKDNQTLKVLEMFKYKNITTKMKNNFCCISLQDTLVAEYNKIMRESFNIKGIRVR